MSSLLVSVFWAVAIIVHVSGTAVVLARRRRRHPRLQKEFTNGPKVTIIQPLCGVEPFSEQTLASTLGLRYPQLEILFCVAEPSDPVVPLVHALTGENNRKPTRLLTGSSPISDNAKLNNVAKGWAAANTSWVLMVDSNVKLDPAQVQSLLASWEPNTGLVCAPPVGTKPANLWAELECAFLNTYQARWQYLADFLGLGFAQGKIMLFRRALVEGAGGISALGNEPAEDAAATKLVRQRGLRVRLADIPASQPLGFRSLQDVWSRQLRWSRLRRRTFLGIFLAEILSGGVPPLLAAALLAGVIEVPPLYAVGVTALVLYGSELLLAYAAGWHVSRRSLVVLFLRDILIPALWVASWLGDGFQWRGSPVEMGQRSRFQLP